jgi:hypothetical protein
MIVVCAPPDINQEQAFAVGNPVLLSVVISEFFTV